jgi:hypothetical protein
MTAKRQRLDSDEVREQILYGELSQSGRNRGRITAPGVGESQPWSVVWLRQGVWYRYALCENDSGRDGI